MVGNREVCPTELLPHIGYLCTAPYYMQDIFRVGITDVATIRGDYLAAKQVVRRREGVVASTPNKMLHFIGGM